MRKGEKWRVDRWNIKTNVSFGSCDIVAHVRDDSDNICDIVCEAKSGIYRAKSNARYIARVPEMIRLLERYAAISAYTSKENVLDVDFENFKLLNNLRRELDELLEQELEEEKKSHDKG